LAERGGAYPPPLAGVSELALELDVAEVEFEHGKAVVGAETDGVGDVGEIEENLEAQPLPNRWPQRPL
jgi:hypothetical protein